MTDARSIAETLKAYGVSHVFSWNQFSGWRWWRWMSREFAAFSLTPRCRQATWSVIHGHTGVMAGRGFYDYSGQTPEERFRDRDFLVLEKLLNELGDIR